MSIIISHIVAAAENDVIGTQNQLPWDIPEDTRFFREKTKGHAIIMGRKTYDSLGEPLPQRLNVVVTRQTNFTAPGIYVVKTIQEGLDFCKTKTAIYGEEIFIIGGGEIYQQSMDVVDVIYLTRIHAHFPGDAIYPKVDDKYFSLIESRPCSGSPAYTFLTYHRKAKTKV
ncbi:MAG: dihydrofolate reductase [Bdellovibrionales bacterium]|nr:dihydrofolate reductase [Bdellovibrionales bacterium]